MIVFRSQFYDRERPQGSYIGTGLNNMESALVFVLMLFACTCHPVSSSDVFVETEYGTVRGRSMLAKPGPNSPAATINTFLAIPFAKAPTGELRWKVRLNHLRHMHLSIKP